MALDKDLQSIQEVREIIQAAKEAQLEFKHFNQSQVDKIVKAMADAGYAEAERLAKMANEETGFGRWEDKLLKNQFSTKNVYESIKNLKTVGIISTEHDGKIVRIAEPMGVVAALIPSTNPTSTAMFKSIISLKCRNAIVASPHPKAINCTTEALKVVRDAAEQAGAPKGLIRHMTIPSIQGTEELMKNDNTAVILATGSNPMVKAAYSAGTPAYGVGAGNVPSFIEKTADVPKAVKDIVAGTTFDYGTLCSSEQAMIVDRPIKEQVIIEAKKAGCYFVSDSEKILLEKAIVKDGRINPEIVGRAATYIAKYAGFSVPSDTRAIVAFCDSVGAHEPLSMEKLSPILAFYTADGWLEGCHRCIELLEFGGVGHTLSIHSNDQEIIMKFALEKPAFRIVVNSLSSLGAVGYTTALNPSLTLGVGTWGGSIVSENVTAKHLMNVKTLAFEVNPINKGNSVNSLGRDMKVNNVPTNMNKGGFLQQIEERLRQRAGNPNVSGFEPTQKQKPIVEKQKGQFGSGISSDEIDKIIREFNK